MKWFKHMADSHSDERLAILRAEAGFEGYGFYWFILETIAKQMDPGTDKTSVTYPVKFWASLGGVSARVWKRLSETLAKLNLITLEISGNSATVNCPNLLKYRDEWSRKKIKNSGAPPEKLRTKDTDTETEEEKNEDSLRSSSCPEPEADSRPKVVGTLPLNSGSGFEVTEDFVAELQPLYPAVDVLQEFRAMKGWLIGNPTKRKTKSGIRRFITAWLSREQDKGGGKAPPGRVVNLRGQAVRDHNDEVFQRLMED